MTTAKEICKNIPTRELESPVAEYHLIEIAKDLVDWETIAPYLDLTESEQKEIQEDYPNRYNLQKQEALRKWQGKNRGRATYKALIEIFCSQKLIKLAQIIAEDLASGKPPRIFDIFSLYLVDCYHDLPHPSNRQWPGSIFQFKMSNFIELTLHETPLNCDVGSVTERKFELVQLSNILSIKKGSKLVLFFEGVAGSGKTTLSWHLCQEWVEHRLLQQFRLLIHVQLNHPQLQSTEKWESHIPYSKKLANLIPYPDEDLCSRVASAIICEEGEGVCFLLDGLDGAPDALLKYLCSIIKDKRSTAPVPKLSLIMTSRPNSRILSHLQTVIDTKVVIEGFSTKKLDEFLQDSFGICSAEKLLLNEKFQICPQLEAICCLPINAVVMAFLVSFLSKQDSELPVTQTGLYKPLICNFLVRHVQTHLGEQCIAHIEDFAVDIPRDIDKSFKLVCEVAYAASLKNTKLFTLKMLDQAKLHLDNSLGFLHIHPKITLFGQKRYYSFPHLSIQEFLAAIHLSLMEPVDQQAAVKQIFNSDPLNQVLSFYAGLTRLSNRTALAVLSDVLKQPLFHINIYKSLLSNPSPSNDPRRKAIGLFRYIYEGEDTTVFDSEINLTPTQENLQILQFNIDLDTLNLFPMDCLAIGYFVRMESQRVRDNSMLIIRLGECSDLGIISFMKELRQGINFLTPGRVRLHFNHPYPSQGMLLSLKNVLQGQSNIQAFVLVACYLKFDEVCFALKCLLEGLYANSSCLDVCLDMFNFHDFHVYYLLLLSQIIPQQLVISNFNVQKTMPLLCEAIKLSPCGALGLFDCCVDDTALLQLGKAICNNTKLECVRIYKDLEYTIHGVIKFLECFINTQSVLTDLYLHEAVLDGAVSVEEYRITIAQVNRFRSIQKRAHLKCIAGQSIVDGRGKLLGVTPGDTNKKRRIEELSFKYPNINRKIQNF